jgi:hypothetical protein
MVSSHASLPVHACGNSLPACLSQVRCMMRAGSDSRRGWHAADVGRDWQHTAPLPRGPSCGRRHWCGMLACFSAQHRLRIFRGPHHVLSAQICWPHMCHTRGI